MLCRINNSKLGCKTKIVADYAKEKSLAVKQEEPFYNY